MRETPTSITEWAQRTFHNPNVLQTATRMNLEMAELLKALFTDFKAGRGSSTRVIGECADVVIMLAQVNELLGLHFNMVAEGEETQNDEQLAISVNQMVGEILSILSSPITGEGRGKVGELSQTMNYYLFEIAWLHGGDLGREIDLKMEINRERSWVKDGAHYQHA